MILMTIRVVFSYLEMCTKKGKKKKKREASHKKFTFLNKKMNSKPN